MEVQFMTDCKQRYVNGMTLNDVINTYYEERGTRFNIFGNEIPFNSYVREFNGIDKNHDGKLSKSEILKYRESQTKAQWEDLIALQERIEEMQKGGFITRLFAKLRGEPSLKELKKELSEKAVNLYQDQLVQDIYNQQQKHEMADIDVYRTILNENQKYGNEYVA